jgi:ribonuclease P protein component
MPAEPEDASACQPEAPSASLSTRFPKSVRLNHPPEFDRVFRTATIRRQRGALRMSAVANRMPSARLGLVVGKRALPRANQRNRAKRVLRETFRHQRSALPPMDIVIQVTGDASNRAYREAFQALLAELATT